MEYTRVKCQVCKKMFEVMRWKLGQGRGKMCSKECRYTWQRMAVRGEKSGRWKGGVHIRSGYRFIRAVEHPHANAMGYVREHRLVMEKKLGRYLEPGEVIHHLDENRLNNHPDNLELMLQGQHSSHHHKGKRHSPEVIEKIRLSNIRTKSRMKHRT